MLYLLRHRGIIILTAETGLIELAYGIQHDRTAGIPHLHQEASRLQGIVQKMGFDLHLQHFLIGFSALDLLPFDIRHQLLDLIHQLIIGLSQNPHLIPVFGMKSIGDLPGLAVAFHDPYHFLNGLGHNQHNVTKTENNHDARSKYNDHKILCQHTCIVVHAGLGHKHG